MPRCQTPRSSGSRRGVDAEIDAEVSDTSSWTPRSSGSVTRRGPPMDPPGFRGSFVLSRVDAEASRRRGVRHLVFVLSEVFDPFRRASGGAQSSSRARVTVGPAGGPLHVNHPGTAADRAVLHVLLERHPGRLDVHRHPLAAVRAGRADTGTRSAGSRRLHPERHAHLRRRRLTQRQASPAARAPSTPASPRPPATPARAAPPAAASLVRGWWRPARADPRSTSGAPRRAGPAPGGGRALRPLLRRQAVSKASCEARQVPVARRRAPARSSASTSAIDRSGPQAPAGSEERTRSPRCRNSPSLNAP